MDLAGLLARVPPGWTRVEVAGRPYGLSRRDRAGGRVITLWAESLSGNEVVSANVWRTRGGLLLRPCEMPAADVIDFLTDFRVSGG